MSRGAALLEQLVGLALLAVILLVVGLLATGTSRSGRHLRRTAAAEALAADLLEARLGGAVEDLPVGPQPEQTGQLSDGTPYTAAVEVYGPPLSDLGPDELKRVRVVVRWRESQGPSQALAESCVARIPR